MRRGSAPAKKARRIRKRAEYVDIQSTGRRVSTPRFVFVLKARDEEPPGPSRLGVTVSRKTGSAVVRNRAKRLVREAFRKTAELWSPGIDVVVIVKQMPKDSKLGDVVAEWQGAGRALERRTKEARAARAAQ